MATRHRIEIGANTDPLDGWSLPAWTYHDPEFFGLEKERVFAPAWQVVCHVSDIPETGDWHTFDYIGESVIVVRGREGVRAFTNVCRHRGSRIVDGSSGCAKKLVCPYHAWTYELDGRLTGVPDSQSYPGLDKAQHGLAPVDMEIWRGFIFVRLKSEGPSVADMMAPYEAMIEPYRFEELKALGRVTLRPREVNWKNIGDNYSDGLHIPVAHPGLTRLFGKSYGVEATSHVDRMWGDMVDETSANWSERAYQHLLPSVPHLPEESQRHWLYFKLWPNVAFDIYPDQVDFMQWLPISPTTSMIREISYVLDDDRREMRAARYCNWRINRQVNAEDTELITRVQQGMSSRSFSVGPLSDKEVCLRHFCSRMRDVIPEARPRTATRRWMEPLMTRKYDAVIIGAGHNGLTCAFYLARAGLKVRIVERRDIVGGAAVTEEFHPGFRNSVASYTVSLLQPKIIKDMQLEAHGYRVIERPISNFLPQEDGGYLKLGGGLEKTQAEFRKFSSHDADVLPAYYEALETVAEVLRGLALKAPPNLGEGFRTLIDGAMQGRGLAKLSLSQKRDVLDLFTKSARSFLDSWFESDAVKAAFGFDAVVGNYASPDTPGSAYVLLHHVFGEVNGKKGAWGHSVGGMGAITQIMAKVCQQAGVEISLESPVAQVLVDGGKATGVRLESGEELVADRVIANVGPKLLYERMIAESDLPPEFRRRIRGFKAGSGTFRMNVALSQLPNFTCLPGEGEHLQSGIILAPTLDYMDEAFLDAKRYGWSKKPIVEMLIPSIVDDSLAPAGQHVASLFCQQFAPELPDGRSWDDEREAAADCIIDTVEAHAPGFKASVIARQIHSPMDLERKFGLVGGDIMHGNMSLDQLWSARPVLGHGSYRGPIKGLYMCGAGTHPGGGVTGAPGHNAAQVIISDKGGYGRFQS